MLGQLLERFGELLVGFRSLGERLLLRGAIFVARGSGKRLFGIGRRFAKHRHSVIAIAGALAALGGGGVLHVGVAADGFLDGFNLLVETLLLLEKFFGLGSGRLVANLFSGVRSLLLLFDSLCGEAFEQIAQLRRDQSEFGARGGERGLGFPLGLLERGVDALDRLGHGHERLGILPRGRRDGSESSGEGGLPERLVVHGGVVSQSNASLSVPQAAVLAPAARHAGHQRGRSSRG